MTLTQFLCPVILFTFAHAFGEEKQVPLACNLKAFTPEEKVAWRNLIDEVRRAESPINELSNGYVFRIDITKVSITRLAEWVDLERKCCPFLDFQVSLHGANGDLSLALTGRQGVKEFISVDFRPWFETR
jgi:hypothetical protein